MGISVSAGGGSSRRLDHTDGLPSDYVNTLFRAKDGRLWAGFRWGFAEMNDGCPAGWPSVREIYPPEPLSSTCLVRGRMWGLSRRQPMGAFGWARPTASSA